MKRKPVTVFTNRNRDNHQADEHTITVKANYSVRRLNMKICIEDMQEIYEEVLSGKDSIKIFHTIIDNLDDTNSLKITLKDVATKAGVSYRYVSNTVKKLKEYGFMKKIGISFMINPLILIAKSIRSQEEAHKMQYIWDIS